MHVPLHIFIRHAGVMFCLHNQKAGLPAYTGVHDTRSISRHAPTVQAYANVHAYAAFVACTYAS